MYYAVYTLHLDCEEENTGRCPRDARSLTIVLELVINQLLAVLTEQMEELGVLHKGHLCNLRRTVGQLPLVEGGEEGAIKYCERGREVRAELVLLPCETGTADGTLIAKRE